MLIDSHAHVNDERLMPEASGIASDMQADNLKAIINAGYDRPSSERAVDLAHKFSGFYATVGIHPHDSKTATEDDYLLFEKLSRDSKVVAVGEIGLDFYYDLSDRDVQKKVFIEQLELADAVGLPVVLHVRDAYGTALDILKANKQYLRHGGVMHSYAGSKETLREVLNLGLYVSYGGVTTFKNFGKADVVKATPLERMLLETDCPYLTPVPYRGKTNYPKFVGLVKDKISEWFPNDDIESITTKNAEELFNLYEHI